MLNDLTPAVRRARDCLTASRAAVLLVDGMTPGAESSAALYERDGVPHLACDTGSDIVVAARRSAEAVLQVDAGDETTAVFTGALAVVGVEQVEAETVDIVALQLVSVEVQHAVYRRGIPLEEYFAAAEDLRCYARRLTEHTNTEHASELRAFAAQHTGRPVASIAAAWVEDITPLGLATGWLDVDGAHRIEITFTDPAQCPVGLVTRVRDVLG